MSYSADRRIIKKREDQINGRESQGLRNTEVRELGSVDLDETSRIFRRAHKTVRQDAPGSKSELDLLLSFLLLLFFFIVGIESGRNDGIFA